MEPCFFQHATAIPPNEAPTFTVTWMIFPLAALTSVIVIVMPTVVIAPWHHALHY